MVLVQSSKLPLPPFLPPTDSFLFEPNSCSLALMHSDSSLSLFPSLPFPSLPSLPSKPQTLIPPPCSSSCFLLLQNPDPRVLFLAASPHKGGSQILLRFYVLQSNNLFSKPQVVCNQKGLAFDPKLGALVDVNHGVSIKIVGSINFFVMHSFSSNKIWVFAVKLIGDGDGDGDVVKLMRCALIDCSCPVWSICMSSSFLILGEDNGVRAFNLRQLVKRKAKRVKSSSSSGNSNLNGKLDGKRFRLPNGVIGNDYHFGSSLGTASNDLSDGKMEKHSVPVKQRFVRCRQNSTEVSMCFVAIERKEVKSLKPITVKAISIQALFPKKFLVLDSTGDLHILGLPNPGAGAQVTSHMWQLPHSMKVQKLAVLPDISSRVQTVWLSDGLFSLHRMDVSDVDAADNKNDGDENQEKLQISVTGAIFSSERIKDLVPSTPSGILTLGQGNIYAYAIS